MPGGFVAVDDIFVDHGIQYRHGLFESGNRLILFTGLHCFQDFLYCRTVLRPLSGIVLAADFGLTRAFSCLSCIRHINLLM